jgi:uncharacterized protein
MVRSIVFALLIAALFGPCAAAAQAGAPASWSAAPTTTVISEPKAFRNGDATLSGTLYLPKGGHALAAVVVTHAASSPLQNAVLYTHLKQMLPPMGIAVFVYDRRGNGQSGGDPKSGDYPLLADDAVAAVKMLKSDARIDPKRIGIWGLSQGGWLSLLAASRSPEVRFVVSISAPVVTPDVQMMFFTDNAMRIAGYPQGEIDDMLATRSAVDAYMRGTGDQATAQRMIDAVKDRPWYPMTYMGKVVRDRATSGWRKEIEYDPLPTLDLVKVPALVLYGTADPVVPVATSVARITAKPHPGVTLRVIAGADHGMELTVSPKDQIDPAKGDQIRPDAPEYFAVLAAWLKGQGIAR